MLCRNALTGLQNLVVNGGLLAGESLFDRDDLIARSRDPDITEPRTPETGHTSLLPGSRSWRVPS